MFRINTIQIDTILKHVRTWNQNMTKYSKIWANGTKKVFDDDKVIPWIAASKSSDQKLSDMVGVGGRKSSKIFARHIWMFPNPCHYYFTTKCHHDFSHLIFDPSPKDEDVIYGRTPRWKIMECTLFCFTGSKDDDDHSLTCFNFLQNHPQWNVFSNVTRSCAFQVQIIWTSITMIRVRP